MSDKKEKKMKTGIVEAIRVGLLEKAFSSQ